MRKLPIIGSAYQPRWLVRRGPTHFSAYRAPLSVDESRVQSAFIGTGRDADIDSDLMVFAAVICAVLTVTLLILNGVITL